MQFAAHIRLADALDAVPSAHLAKLSKKLGRELATTLAERANVARRLDRLPNGAVDLLAELTGGDGHELELFQSEGQDERTLLNAGFVLPVEREGLPSHVIPFEVRAAIFPVVGPPNAPLAVHLTTWEPEELEELAGLHNAELRADPYDDAMSAAIELAETMLEPERVADLFESLTSAAKRLLHWVCEANVEVRPDEIAARSARFAELAGEPSGTAERVLVRLGILHEASSAGLDWIVVPVDLYLALEPVVEEATAARCRELYAKLRDGAHPAFRDTFPRGANGDALLSARRIVARAAAGDTASVGRDRLTAVLQVMRILESSGGVAELAAAHLDSATADRFAQQCLRTWVDSIDDEFTRVLMAPFGGDIGALADAIFGDPAPEDMFIGAWATFLARLRGELL